MAYLLDTNIFIDAKNRYYDMHVCPAFWEWLVLANGAGKVFSIGRVRDELTDDSEDELAWWAGDLDEDFFLPAEEDDLTALGRIATWINDHGRYSEAAKATFLASADYYLIAQASAGDYTVVTHEVPADSVHRVKIPNVCVAQYVKYINPWTMLRREHARFVLASMLENRP